MDSEKQSFPDKVAEKLIEQLREGTAPWQKPWHPGEASSRLPVNPVTGNRYKGINALHLMSEGREDQRWMTYKQAESLDAQVRKGEKGTAIQYWKFTEEQLQTDTNGKPIFDARGEPVKETVQLERPRVFFATVAQNRTEVDMGIPREGADDQTLTQRAEAWVLARLEQRTLLRAMDSASDGQLEKIGKVLSDMAPASTDNPFWQRHVLPDGVAELPHKIAEAREAAEQRLLDSPIAKARKDLLLRRAGNEASADDGEALIRESESVLGFSLPQDWNGRARVEAFGTEMIDGEPTFTTLLPKGAQPEGWGVFTEHSDGRHTMVGSYASEKLANAVADRLSLLDAHSTLNEHEAAAKLARINEERVRRDPDSTEEDIAAARELRKNTDFVAVTQDEDLQRRIASEQAQKVKQAQSGVDAAAGRMMIDVPYKQKDEAKALGAKWDRQEQSWFVPPGIDPAPFAKWVPQAREAAAETLPVLSGEQSIVTGAPEAARQYLAVPFDDRAQAKAAGAQWDRSARSWYAVADADLAKLEKWKPENIPSQQAPAMAPREEFAEALRAVGCVVSGEHPVMDGKKHRISVEGEKFSKNAGSGFYVGHLDGHPAGYVKNNKTGEELSWKAKGYALDPEQKALLAAQAATKQQQQREADLSRRQEQAAARVARQAQKLVPVTEPTAYMQAKGIAAHAGALTDKDGKKTYVPAIDADGKQWSMQYIQEDGTKRFAKDSRKDGCFHVIGGMDQLTSAPALVIAEGYATAATLKQALGHATVAAFDAGNLAQVARALHDKFPNKPVVIAGDDDRHLEATQGANPGRTKAEEAANLVGGKVLLPIFAPGENSFPAGVEPVTAHAYRQHRKGLELLSDEQTGALDRMKQFTDFNDLATRSVLGMDGVGRQVRSAVMAIVDKHQHALVQEQEVALVQPQEEGVSLKPKRKRTAATA